MSPSLSSRIAAATAAARADTEPCCVFCRAVDVPLVPWSEPGWAERFACAQADACHERFCALNGITPAAPLPEPLDGRETGRSAVHAPESSTSDLEGN